MPQTVERRDPTPPPRPLQRTAIPVAVPALGSQPIARVRTTRTRNTAIALLAASVLMLVGSITHAWFYMGGDGVGLVGIGTWDMNTSWFDLPVPTELKLFSAIGLIGIAASVAYAIHAAVALFRHRPQDVLLLRLNASLGLAAFGCTSLFFYLAFSRFSQGFTVGYAGIVTLAAVAGASIVIGTRVRPMVRVSR